MPKFTFKTLIIPTLVLILLNCVIGIFVLYNSYLESRPKKVVKLTPENTAGWNDLAMCYFQTNQPKKAIITLQNALEYYAKNTPIMPTSDYLLGKSCTFALLNDKEQAFKFLAEACKISPDCKQKVKAKNEFEAYFNDETFREITK